MEEIKTLAEIKSVMHGDIANIYSKIQSKNAYYVNSPYIISELLKMQQEKSCEHKIGFCL